MDLLDCQLLTTHSISTHRYSHGGFAHQNFWICSHRRPSPIHDHFDLGTQGSIVAWRSNDQSLRLTKEWIKLIHVVFDYTLSILDTIIAMSTWTNSLAAYSE